MLFIARRTPFYSNFVGKYLLVEKSCLHPSGKKLRYDPKGIFCLVSSNSAVYCICVYYNQSLCLEKVKNTTGLNKNS